MISCPKCGTENPPASKFCHQCGAPLLLDPSRPVVATGAITVLQICIAIISNVMGLAVLRFAGVLSAISVIIWLIGAVLWIVLMVKAYQGQRYRLPILGKLAEQCATKTQSW